MLTKAQPFWVNNEMADLIDRFVKEQLKINPKFVFSHVVKCAVRFALSKPEEFKEYLDEQMKVEG